MSAVLPRPADNRDSFPSHLLRAGDSALVLFAAAFNGVQDAVWILDGGLRATCVDHDRHTLERMAEYYPDTWDFVAADAFDFCEETTARWDVVTVDCPTNLFRLCADNVALWCRRSRSLVVLGTGTTTEVSVPDGWKLEERRRRSNYDGGVYWDVLVKA